MVYTRKEKAKYSTKRLVEVVSQTISKPIARWILKRRLDIDVIGTEKKPKDDSFIEVFNHATYADGLILGAYEQRTIHFWIQKEDPENRLSIARKTLYNFLIWMWGHIGVNVIKSKSGNKNAIKRSIDYLNFRKNIIAIFPEGPTINAREYIPIKERPPVHRGAAYIALAAKKPIVPIGICVDLPEYLQPVIFERTRKNKKIICNHIKKYGKLNYRVAIGDPIYVQNKTNNNCELVIGNPEAPLHIKKVYFENQRELETILINEAMEQCYKLADPNNIEGKLIENIYELPAVMHIGHI